MSGKLVCLMRHSEALAQLSETVTRDFDKPLTDKGIHQLEYVRAFLKQHHFLPDLILCSPAVRTRQTLEWIQEALGTEAEVKFDEELYDIKANALMDKLAGISNKKSTVLVLGHNPVISETMQTLLNRSEPHNISVRLPVKPAQLAIFHLNSNAWSTLSSDKIYLDSAYEPEN